MPFSLSYNVSFSIREFFIWVSDNVFLWGNKFAADQPEVEAPGSAPCSNELRASAWAVALPTGQDTNLNHHIYSHVPMSIFFLSYFLGCNLFGFEDCLLFCVPSACISWGLPALSEQIFKNQRKEELSALLHVKNIAGEHTLVLGRLWNFSSLCCNGLWEETERIMYLLWALRYHLFLTSFIAAFPLGNHLK